MYIKNVAHARSMQALVADRAKCQDTSSRTMFQKLDFIANRLTSMPKGTRLPVSYAPVLQYFEAEILNDTHVLNADIGVWPGMSALFALKVGSVVSGETLVEGQLA